VAVAVAVARYLAGPVAGAAVVAAGAVGWIAWVFLGPVPGGRRTYVVAENGLTAELEGDCFTVPWQDVTMVWHLPFADGDVTYHDHLELETASHGDVIVADAHGQTALAAMVVTQVAAHVKEHLIGLYDEIGTVDLGDWTVEDRGARVHGRLVRWYPLWTLDRKAGARGDTVRITTDAP
jgi:hypothetical protein